MKRRFWERLAEGGGAFSWGVILAGTVAMAAALVTAGWPPALALVLMSLAAAAANALIIPQARLYELLQVAQEFFGLPDGPRPLYSFVSAFDVNRKSAAEWADLHALGLNRAYIGLETGDDDLLRFVNKPGTVRDAIEAVRALRAGGVAVGVIVMAGIGGDRFADMHVQRSVEAIRAMDLGPDDLRFPPGLDAQHAPTFAV